MSEAIKQIIAAGTVVLRPADGGGIEVLMVHRPRYDDWSLPKGKLEADEYLPVCAVRETDEETSTTVRLGLPIGEITYPVGGGQKAVSYWVGQAIGGRRHRPNSEVDQTGWLSITNALRRASYPDEREVIRQAVNLPATTPLMILRHAKAMVRSEWNHRDQTRPLAARGQRQSQALTPFLSAYGVDRLVSSAATRCAATLQPFAEASRLTVEECSAFTEEEAEKDPRSVTRLIRELATETASSGRPTVVCGHRPVFPTMLAALGVPEQALPPAAALVAHLSPNAEVIALEFHKPLI
jgi:8-oxo-(d)GTP phosphatase